MSSQHPFIQRTFAVGYNFGSSSYQISGFGMLGAIYLKFQGYSLETPQQINVFSIQQSTSNSVLKVLSAFAA
jgi:hypothetical protein